MSATDWPPEQIPDADTLFYRVHKTFIPEGELQPAVFQDRGGGMSTNWKKYCLGPEAARAKARKPEDNGVVSFVAGAIRSVPLSVEHTPNASLADRSHTDVIGEKTTKIRAKLRDLVSWEIKI